MLMVFLNTTWLDQFSIQSSTGDTVSSSWSSSPWWWKPPRYLLAQHWRSYQQNALQWRQETHHIQTSHSIRTQIWLLSNQSALSHKTAHQLVLTINVTLSKETFLSGPNYINCSQDIAMMMCQTLFYFKRKIMTVIVPILQMGTKIHKVNLPKFCNKQVAGIDPWAGLSLSHWALLHNKPRLFSELHI